jgi:hypothetical protein
MLPVNYPVESFFWPYHLVIALVTSAIFFVIISSYRHFLVRIREREVDKTGKVITPEPTIEKIIERTTDNKTGVISEKTIEKTTGSTPETTIEKTIETTQEMTGRITKKTIEKTIEKPQTTSQKLMGQADTIALGSLILSIVVTGILPFLLSPLLDYSASPQENGTKLTITMTNLGLASANNIMGSVSAKNVTFSNFESQPFLANHFRANSSILGKGFFEITTMPPRSETNVTATLNASTADKNEPILVYVRSDERTGFHDTLITSLFYLGLGITYVMLFIYLVYWEVVAGKYEKKWDSKTNKFVETGKFSKNWKKLDKHGLREIVFIVVIIAAGDIVFTAIYYYFYYPFPPIFNLPPV